MPSTNGHVEQDGAPVNGAMTDGITGSNGSLEHDRITQLFRLEKRTIAITGGLGGLGATLTEALLLSGADVFSTDVPAQPSSEIWESLQATAARTNTHLAYHACDVTSEESVSKAFAHLSAIARHPLRGLVACAGISGRCPATSYPIADFRRIMDVNVTGTFLCCQAAARLMHTQNVPGSIVLLASMSGTAANRGVATAPYNASKAAVQQLARNLAAEWGGNPDGYDRDDQNVYPVVRVNTLSPGYIRTPITLPTFEGVPGLREMWNGGNMLGRLSDSEEHVSSVLFLLGDGSSYITGTDLRADGGHTAW